MFGPDGRRVATGSIDGTVKVWDAASGQLLLTYEGHQGLIAKIPDFLKVDVPRPPVMCLAFSPDGRHIASGGFEPKLGKLRELRGVVKVWDAQTGAEVLTFQEQLGVILSLDYSPDGRRIASSSINQDNTFVVWDAKTKAVIRVVAGHTSHVHRLRYSPDGRLLASGDTDGSIKLWDAATLMAVRTIDGHRGPVVGLAFAPDGDRFASASEDGTVRVWETASGAAVFSLRGHTGSAFAVAFSPDGKRLASGGFDKTVRLWDAATGKEKMTLAPPHRYGVGRGFQSGRPAPGFGQLRQASYHLGRHAAEGARPAGIVHHHQRTHGSRERRGFQSGRPLPRFR